jgi:lipid-binding SYLF domain-containing protein
MRITLSSILAVFALTVVSQFAQADDYDEARKIFMDAGESGAFFANSYGYALFPSIGKGGMGIGGAHGKGRVYVGGKHVGNTSMTQVTVGLQLGGQVYSQIIFFEDERAFKEFSSGNFEFGAQATAVAITAAAGAQTTTGGGTSAGASGGKSDATTASTGYHKGMAIFTVAKGGLMYEATLGGQKYKYEAI